MPGHLVSTFFFLKKKFLFIRIKAVSNKAWFQMALAFSTFLFQDVTSPRVWLLIILLQKRNETRRDGNGIMSLSMIRSPNIFF